MSAARIVAVLVGSVLLAIWLPVLVAGLATLLRRGAFGQTDDLIVTGVYAFVRHPLYAGLCFTLIGAGLVLGRWTLALGGLAWLAVTQLWSIHEEADLARRFGPRYEEYRRATPRLVPAIRPAAEALLARVRGTGPTHPG